ncbi:MAG: alpha/beta hydrolase [Thioalkalispiraceae bacterium]|jgi:pimeloyl-ACP methyl ester carboxylesterase
MKDYLFQHNNQTLHCRSSGSETGQSAMIFLHGLASNATRWHELMSNLSMKDVTYLLAMDLRGHGQSMTYNRYQRQDWCDDVNKLVTDLKRPTIIVGHSMGAQIALGYATQHQEYLRGLILIDPIFPEALTGWLKKTARIRWLVFFVAAMLRIFNKLGIRQRQYLYRDLYKLDCETRDFLANNPDRDIADLYMNPLVDLEFIPLVNYLQDLFEVTRKLPALDSIQVPVLVLLSSGASTSNVETNRRLLSTIPKLEIKTINADHWLLTEKPNEAREIIESWSRQKLGQQTG